LGAAIIYKYFPDLSERQKSQIEQLHSMYTAQNKKVNVISRKDIEQINRLYKCPNKRRLENLDDCALFNSSVPQVRKKNIKSTNLISLGLEDEDTWVSCRTGRCFKKTCKANFNKKSDRIQRNSFTTLSHICTGHQFTLRTTISRARSDKVKVGDNITLEWGLGRFLDCSSISGKCSTAICDPLYIEGSGGAEECSNHNFRIASKTKKIGDIVQTYDEIQLEYVHNGKLQYLDCRGPKCVVHSVCTAPNEAINDGEVKGQLQVKEKDPQVELCKLPSFIIQK